MSVPYQLMVLALALATQGTLVALSVRREPKNQADNSALAISAFTAIPGVLILLVPVLVIGATWDELLSNLFFALIAMLAIVPVALIVAVGSVLARPWPRRGWLELSARLSAVPTVVATGFSLPLIVPPV